MKLFNMKNEHKCEYCRRTSLHMSDLNNQIRSSIHTKCKLCDNKCDEHQFFQNHIANGEGRSRRKCHYFNSNKWCPFYKEGCKFIHEYNPACRNGESCDSHMCEFKHL